MNNAYEVVEKAIQTDKQGFLALLTQQAEDHKRYLRTTTQRIGIAGASVQLASCERCIEHVDSINKIMDKTSSAIIAFNVACKVLGISPAERTRIAIDSF